MIEVEAIREALMNRVDDQKIEYTFWIGGNNFQHRRRWGSIEVLAASSLEPLAGESGRRFIKVDCS